MRILALDVGDKTIGVAVSDELLLTAQGVNVIRRQSWVKDLKQLRDTVARFDVDRVVVGLPRNMDGSYGPRSELVSKFTDRLRREFSDLEFVFWDERLSTVAAERSLIAADVSRAKRRQVIDKMAAVFILQGYLDNLSRQRLLVNPLLSVLF
jgi:putative holliday junction resolvase